jgi:flagellar basal body-associated protein FliL
VADSTEKATSRGAKEKKKKSPLLIFLLIGLLAAGGAVAAYLFLFSKGTSEAEATEGGGGHGGGHGKKGGHGASTDVGIISPDVFIVNLADRDAGAHFVKCSLRLVIAPPETAEEVRASEVTLIRIRDRIISILSFHTTTELKAPGGKEKLRTQIKEGLSDVLPEGSLQEVLFSEFLIQ